MKYFRIGIRAAHPEKLSVVGSAIHRIGAIANSDDAEPGGFYPAVGSRYSSLKEKTYRRDTVPLFPDRASVSIIPIRSLREEQLFRLTGDRYNRGDRSFFDKFCQI
ncbi:hypothetical protein [Lyngbya sp. CCY1209]|uniref:hypothetical protein n=1 Tax=Lyngbya sp. CCY1209 TaxID=2886103 RepID=UPI002D2139C4|nr:hypothetical protein [Lyngbya sp. CCY1209]MEB3885417.1 hypothetical protein [Lyngbya sp. CCY1209]